MIRGVGPHSTLITPIAGSLFHAEFHGLLHGDRVAETRLTDLLMPAPLQGARDLNRITPRMPESASRRLAASTARACALGAHPYRIP